MLLKFIFDRIVSLFGLIILWPVFLAIALFIKIKMPGKVFFIQNRVGRYGKLIRVHKFRTMRERTKDDIYTGIAAAELSRITPLGAFLRKYKLDELPELWDVLIGNMSFVGPRPDVPGYADKLVGRNRAILKLRPGITGPASLKYRDEETILAHVNDPIRYNDEIIFPDKVRLNLYYLDHYSFFVDLQIILATVFDMRIKYAGEVI